ncbi:hypothetical protein FBULB1_9587 [Fusarium bulbicola]|nr:hypothetical protein FBULB1_9587 [Fusarium bulbicola]
MPSQPVTPSTAQMDGDITVSRDSNTTISESKELSWGERATFSDLLLEWCSTRANTQTVTADDQKSFFEQVFNLWDSDDDMIAMQTLHEKKLKETSVAVGYFVENLPVTPSKRKRGETLQTNPRRMARSPAYMSVKLEGAAGTDLELYWKDEGGSAVSSKFVKFKDGVTKPKAIETATINWDKREMARVEEYNTKLIIALARMRIVRFAKVGTEHPPYIPQDLWVNNRTLKCQLMSDEFEEVVKTVEAVCEGFSRSKVGAPSHMM